MECSPRTSSIPLKMINNLIEKPNNKKALVFFSGASKKSFKDLFNIESFKNTFNIYEVILDFENTTFVELINQIKTPLGDLSNYDEKIAICKSFGGIISLLLPVEFNKYIFLASPIILGDSTINKIFNTNLDELELTDIVFSKSILIDKNITIFQGTNDKDAFKTISKNLQNHLNCDIQYLNTDHSFQNVKKELENLIVEKVLIDSFSFK